MFRRSSLRKQGANLNRGLAPMAEKLGLDVYEAFWVAPTTPEARTLDAFRIGLGLLANLANPESWPTGFGSARMLRRAAKLISTSLITPGGACAVAYMTHGYGTEMASFWRRAAGSGEPGLDPEALNESARRSEELARFAAAAWPVSDPHGALRIIAEAESSRSVDLDNPHAMVDLRGHYGRASIAMGAAGLALGSDVASFEGLLFSPVQHLDVEFSVGLSAEWIFQADLWTNLLSDNPTSRATLISTL